jgi:DNA-binding transcriptional LysR family regulator
MHAYIEFVTGYGIANLARGEADIALCNRLPDHNSLVVRRLGTAGLAFFASRAWIARNGVPG